MSDPGIIRDIVKNTDYSSSIRISGHEVQASVFVTSFSYNPYVDAV